MRLNEYANAEVSIHVASPSSTDARDDGYVMLDVEDRASGEALVRVEIPAGRWWRLMQGATQHHPAFVSTHLDRVGKRMEVRIIDLGHDAKTPEDAEALYPAAAEGAGVWDWESHSVRRTNRGWEAVVRRWVSDAAMEESDETWDQIVNDPDYISSDDR